MSTTTNAQAGQDAAVRYGGWSKDRQGWFLGLSGGAWIVIIAGGLPALLAAGAHRWPLALGWLPVWGVLIVAVAVPVRGRPALRWVIDCLYRAVGIVAGRSHWQSRAATGTVDRLAEADLPGVLSGIRTHDGPPFGPLLARPAVIADNRERTWAVVARVHHPGIGLAEATTRARMGAGLCGLLDAAATAELISLVTLQVRTIPDDGAERGAWQRTHLRPEAPALAHAVTGELSAVMTQAGVRHEAFLTVVVPESRIARHAREAGGGVDGRARVLYGVMTTLEASLLGPLGASAVVWLDSAGLAAAIRTGFAPGDRAMLRTAELDAHQRPSAGSGSTGAWPMAAAGPSTAPPPERRHYQHDAWRSVSSTVLLPDRGAVMGALAPVFTPTEAGERRCVTVFFEPIPRHKADRLVGAQAMSAGTAAELRTRMGFRTRAVHRRDAARVEGQDQRLAEGSALVRTAVVAAVTVPDTWPIADYGRRLESAITAAGFSPLRLDLAQDSGFAAACVPLGIGLPRRRGIR